MNYWKPYEIIRRGGFIFLMPLVGVKMDIKHGNLLLCNSNQSPTFWANFIEIKIDDE
jgi:hypothetical protein